MTHDMTGGCQCGRIRYSASVARTEGYLCHCRMCQKATGGVSIAFINLPKTAVEWETEPDWYHSSPIARRPFCSKCGTPLGFAFLDGENIDLTVGSLDDPYPIVPTHNFAIEKAHAAWQDTSHLPGQRVDEWEPTISRWRKAIGEVPD